MEIEMETYFDCNLFKDDIDNFINLYHFSRKEKQYESGKIASPSNQRYKIAKNFESRKLTPEIRAFLMYLHLTRQNKQSAEGADPLGTDNRVPPMPPVELSPQEKGYNKYINSVAYKNISSIQPDYVSGYLQDYKDGIDLDWDDIQIKINTYFKKRFPV